jgi:hypothetical protein
MSKRVFRDIFGAKPCINSIMPTKKIIATFETRTSATSDKKPLKSGNKIYTYGTISIRDSKLNEYIRKKVVVRVLRRSNL